METIDYFLRRYREEVIRKRKAGQEIEAQLAALEAQLRRDQFDAEAPTVEVAAWEQPAQGMDAD